MLRATFCTSLLAISLSTFAADADVLRFNPRKTTAKPATAPAAAPAAPVPKSGDSLNKQVPPSASLTASTKLEPR